MTPRKDPRPPKANKREGPLELPWVQAVRRRLVDPGSRKWGRLALGLVFLLSILLRFEDAGHWAQSPRYFFQHGQPFILSVDGYYYLRLADDVLRHQYHAVDELRTAPERGSRPAVIPLLSLLVYLLKRAFPFASLNQVAVALPPFLGALVVFPVWGICRTWGLSIFASLVACASASLSVAFFDRTRMGYFDTDGLVLVLTLLICEEFVRFSLRDDRRRYGHYAGAVAALLLLVWTWSGAAFIALGIFVTSWLVSMLFFYRAPKREAYTFYAVNAVVGLLIVLVFAKQLTTAFQDTLSHARLVAGAAASGFPDTHQHVTELERPGFHELWARTAGSIVGFVAGVVGLLLLARAHPRKAALVAAPIVIGILSLFLGRRFLIFTGTAVAIGTAYGVEWIIRAKLRHAFLATCLALSVLAYLNIAAATAGITASRATYATFPGTDRLKEVTAPRSIIWSDVDSGYLLMYWTRRRTIADPDRIDGEHQFYTYFPLTVESPRLAANFMRFYGTRGRSGLHRVRALCGGDLPGSFRLVREILAAGPDGADSILHALPPGMRREGDADVWRAFFFPREPVRIYLFLHAGMPEFIDTWFGYGSWDLARRRGEVAAMESFSDVRRQGKTIAIASAGVEFDLDRGATLDLSVGGHEQPLAYVMEYDGQARRYKRYGYDRGFALEYLSAPAQPAGFGALMTLPVANSVFANLFVGQGEPGRYFSPVLLQAPDFQIWEVLGDSSPEVR